MNSELSFLLEVIKSLPYGRNANRADYSLVPIEQKGSCSTKHAYIKSIATQKGWENVKLILCVYMMSPENTKGVTEVLAKYKLTEIPEAHTYLKIDGRIVDVTGLAESENSFEESIIISEEIQPEQIGEYKISFHKKFISNWAEKTAYTIDRLWEIREDCISALSE